MSRPVLRSPQPGDQQGFILMIVVLVLLIGAAMVFAFLRVKHLHAA